MNWGRIMEKRLMAVTAIILSWTAPSVLACPSVRTELFLLRVTRMTFVPGQIFRYAISSSNATVTYENDEGVKTRELWHATPTQPQVERLYRFLKNLPIDKFRQMYSRSEVADGFEIDFTFVLDGGAAKTVVMRNAWEPDLRRLCIQLNELLPTKLQLAVPPPGVDPPNDIVLESIDGTPSPGN